MSAYTPLAHIAGSEAEIIIDTLTNVDTAELADTVASIVEYHVENQYDGEPLNLKVEHHLSFPVFTEEEHFTYEDYLLITDTDWNTVHILRRINTKGITS